ncbi:MAG TPA: DNA polymerase I [Tissierellales bacterium]|nr:DNA polymerase I [Tissierellales bacterium]
MKKEKLIIIDGSSLLHRAFYALPLLSTKDGIYTNGVLGFMTMLNKINEDYNPEYMCVAFDKKGPTFRHLEYELYKAQRDSTPNELSLQFPILKEILKSMNIYQMEMDQYEADDIAGTIARLGEEEGLDVMLVSGDRDFLQLATDNTKVLITKKGITQLEEYDEKKFIETYGITPKQFIDLKGLMGDQSDNIPGVPGIGEKTGLKLLKEFNSMEGVYENIDKVTGKKRKESLIEHKQTAFLSKKLSEIITNIPLDLTIKDLKVEEPNWDELIKLYEKFELRRLLEQLPHDKVNIESESTYEPEFEIITEESFEEIVEEIKNSKKFAFKLIFKYEDFVKDEILGAIIKVKDKNAYYIDFEENSKSKDAFITTFKPIFEDESIEKIGHRLKGDIVGLFRVGIDIKNITFDSMIGQYLLNPAQSNYDIDELSREHLNINIRNEEELLGKGRKKKSYKDLKVQERANYFSILIDMVFMLENPIKGLIASQGMEELFYNIELPLIKVLANMEYVGFKININVLEELKEEFNKKIDKLTEEIYTLSGEEFNINSPKQLGEILFDRLDLPVIKKTKTGYSTNAEVLDKLKGKHPIIEKILEYRQIVKLKSTYVDGLMDLIDKETKRIHSSFNQTVTNTGRISSTEPNLQNIPIKTEEGRKIRKAFVTQSEDYILIDGDYSQIELRVLAHITEDEKLQEAFYESEDIHLKTASEVFEVPKEEVTPLLRNRAKAVNFGIVYGISDYGLSRDLDISRKEAKNYIDKYLENYAGVKTYMDSIVELGKKQGYVDTILKRRRYLPELKSRNYAVRSFGERVALNTPIQGSAADIIKVAMVEIYNELERKNMKSKLILQVHDELIIEAHKDEAKEVEKIMANIMENCVKLNVPLEVDMQMGESWYDTK